MITQEVTSEERQTILCKEIYRRGYLTVTQAWEVGYKLGFYRGGDGSLAKSDLQELAKHRKITYHEGFWRHINEPDRIRLKHKHWADYWTPRGR